MEGITIIQEHCSMSLVVALAAPAGWPGFQPNVLEHS